MLKDQVGDKKKATAEMLYHLNRIKQVGSFNTNTALLTSLCSVNVIRL